VRILVAGDIHGHWRSFRDTVEELHAKAPLDAVLQCGDAQPLRDPADLEYMNCPSRFRDAGDFQVFFKGTNVFPVPMLFIGGNHEPWGYLDEYRQGGELTTNIEFLGRVGMRDICGLRVAGISGVHSPIHFDVAHPAPPYPPSRRKAATYYNREDVSRANAFVHADILLLHEWPDLMNAARSASWPSHWRNVGSSQLSAVVDRLSPSWCFCGHMHFAAQCRSGCTQIVCLSDFHCSSADSVVILDTEDSNYYWPLRHGEGR
jgi:lariat debranching enzyme